MMPLWIEIYSDVEKPPKDDLKNRPAQHVQISKMDVLEPLESKYPEPSPAFAPPQGKKPRGGRARTVEAIQRRKSKKRAKLQHAEITAKYHDLCK